jgi:hypothetical protein
MQLDASFVDPWTRTINLLSLPDGPLCPVEEPIERPPKRRTSADSNASTWEPCVTAVDRPSSTTVVLDWRDPTKCCYREQLWIAARARVAGRCAMSGAAITPGDEIFRPRPARPVPRNVSAMILASAVDACAAYEPPLRDRSCIGCPGDDVATFEPELAFDSAGAA